jgi:hypothetical protein
MCNVSGVSWVSVPEQYVLLLRQREAKARELVPEEDVCLWDGRMGREEGDDGVGVGLDGGDSWEEGGGMEGAGVEEVGGLCEVNNHAYRCEDWSEN